MPGLRSILQTTAGKAAAATLFISIGYIVWLLGFNTHPEIEPYVSVVCLNIAYILFIYFGVQMLRKHPMSTELRRAWILIIAATGSLTIGEFIYTLSNRPPLSLAELFYLCYYFLYVFGILRFPFIP